MSGTCPLDDHFVEGKLVGVMARDCDLQGEPLGHDVDAVRFPDSDLAAIARAAGAEGVTVRAVPDLAALDDWLDRSPSRPLVLDAKVNPTVCAEWLAEAFRGG